MAGPPLDSLEFGASIAGDPGTQLLDHSMVWGSILRQGLRPLGKGRLKQASASQREDSKGRT